MYISLLKIVFMFFTSAILFGGLLINCLEPLTPEFFRRSFRYGKFGYQMHRSAVGYLEVPKSWFKHFYIVAVLTSTYFLVLAFLVFIGGSHVPAMVMNYLNFVGSEKRCASVNATSVLLALILWNFQTWRRFYETFFVSIFSDTKINIMHYLVGLIHYVGAVSSIVSESPLFSEATYEYNRLVTFSDITWRSIFGTLLFIWAWYNQYRAATILANLRKDRDGKVVTLEHKIPTGHFFDKISSPHMFFEMIMYLAFYIILWGNSTWPYIFFWVFTNQCESALLNHWWYQSKFESYPKNRRAFIPYIL